MKTKPILFSGPMVRALLEGRKSQTRRVVSKYLPTDEEMRAKGQYYGYGIAGDTTGRK